MTRVPPKPPYPLHLLAGETERLWASPAEADHEVALLVLDPGATPQPKDAPSEDDLIEAGFDNMPV